MGIQIDIHIREPLGFGTTLILSKSSKVFLILASLPLEPIYFLCEPLRIILFKKNLCSIHEMGKSNNIAETHTLMTRLHMHKLNNTN